MCMDGMEISVWDDSMSRAPLYGAKKKNNYGFEQNFINPNAHDSKLYIHVAHILVVEEPWLASIGRPCRRC